MQELADAVSDMLLAISHCLLKGQASLALPQCLPYLTRMADSWTAYACTEEQDTPASTSPDSSEPPPPLPFLRNCRNSLCASTLPLLLLPCSLITVAMTMHSLSSCDDASQPAMISCDDDDLNILQPKFDGTARSFGKILK